MKVLRPPPPRRHYFKCNGVDTERQVLQDLLCMESTSADIMERVEQCSAGVGRAGWLERKAGSVPYMASLSSLSQVRDTGTSWEGRHP